MKNFIVLKYHQRTGWQEYRKYDDLDKAIQSSQNLLKKERRPGYWIKTKVVDINNNQLHPIK